MPYEIATAVADLTVLEQLDQHIDKIVVVAGNVVRYCYGMYKSIRQARTHINTVVGLIAPLIYLISKGVYYVVSFI
jgi:hypothetical protein